METDFQRYRQLWAEPVPDSEVKKLEEYVGFALPEDYKGFVVLFGGAIVGPYSIFGLRSAEAMGTDEASAIVITERFRQKRWPGTEEWLVVSMDQAGNPVGIDLEGRVWIADHDAGAVEVISGTFDEYLRRKCLKLAK